MVKMLAIEATYSTNTDIEGFKYSMASHRAFYYKKITRGQTITLANFHPQ